VEERGCLVLPFYRAGGKSLYFEPTSALDVVFSFLAKTLKGPPLGAGPSRAAGGSRRRPGGFPCLVEAAVYGAGLLAHLSQQRQHRRSEASGGAPMRHQHR